MTSIGLTHNQEWRDNGTARYCLEAFKKLQEAGEISEVKHYQPRGEVGKHDFYFYCDDGRDDLKWIPPHPNAYYAIDTHLGYGYRLWKARHFDRVFVAQKDAVEQFRREGVTWVKWLPLACLPEAHISADEFRARGADEKLLKRTWDVAFVGFLNEENRPGYNNRVAYLDRLFRRFKKSWLSAGVFHEQMALRYCKARLGFNVSIRRDLNMRCFEVMSTKTPLLTNRNVEGIDELFTEGEHYFGYENPDEMIGVAEWALKFQARADRVAAQAFELVRSKHTYVDRMRTVTEEMKHAC